MCSVGEDIILPHAMRHKNVFGYDHNLFAGGRMNLLANIPPLRRKNILKKIIGHIMADFSVMMCPFFMKVVFAKLF